jgi:hypothetical protein
VERAFVEERRRTKVIPPLWDGGSVVRLVYGVFIRVSERWGKECFSEFEQQQIRSLREKLKLDEQEVSIDEPDRHLPTRRSAASAAYPTATGKEGLDQCAEHSPRARRGG